MHIAAIGTKVQYRITDELAGTVIGYVPSATRFVNFNGEGFELFRFRKNVGVVGSPAKGKDVRVFEQQELFRRNARLERLERLILKPEPVRVIDGSEPPGFTNHARGELLR
jgi:hypothetical protein